MSGFEALLRGERAFGNRSHPAPPAPGGLAKEAASSCPLVGGSCGRLAPEPLAGRATTTRRQISSVSVNVSACPAPWLTWSAPSTPRCAGSGLEPSRLVLEITETAPLVDRRAAARRLCEVRAFGVHVALDDFGTGHSSLAYLRELPVDILKIDRSFVATITEHGQLPPIVWWSSSTCCNSKSSPRASSCHASAWVRCGLRLRAGLSFRATVGPGGRRGVARRA